jgi:hypothetical protein
MDLPLKAAFELDYATGLRPEKSGDNGWFLEA